MGPVARPGRELSERRRRARRAALPLAALSLLVCALCAFSGGAVDAIAGLPMLLLAVCLLGGRIGGIEALLDWSEGRRRAQLRPRARGAGPRPRSHLAPALHVLAGGRGVRGPPAACA